MGSIEGIQQILKRLQERHPVIRLAGVSGAALIVGYGLLKTIKSHKSPNRTKENNPDAKAEAYKVDKRIGKVGVDLRFLKQFQYILKICIPSWKSPTVLYIVLHTFFLVLRTYLSVVVARLDGRLVKDLVAADGKSFMKSLGFFMLVALPATYTNSMIRYLQSKLSLALRTSLTRHVHQVYMSDNTFYKAINLDNRIEGADQLITTDINRFSTALANLYSNLGKPLLDVVIFNYQLGRSIGIRGMIGLSINYWLTANLMRAITPPFGKLAAQEAKLEGDFRSAHSRIITNAEEIAFYNGEDLEKNILNKTYNNLIKHINGIFRVRIAYNMFEDFVVKYTWSAVGLLISSIPVFFPHLAGSRTLREEAAISLEEGGNTSSELITTKRTGSRTQGFITNKRLMLSLGDAGGRIMYSYKELSELAGYTYRVYNMLRVLDDLKNNRFIGNSNATESVFSLERIHGEFVYGNNGIRFVDTPIVTPYGDTILVDKLSFQLRPGDHLMVTGPNGAGKTSILRVLAGLWPHFAGSIHRPTPALSSIMYIPQRPYLAIGTLREQVIYPHTVEDMNKAGRTDQELMDILKIVYLDYIPAREGGWDAIKEWKDVFSGGEKQRMQLARLFYHRPQFAVLDEATSAVSTDVEGLLYSSAKDVGMTLITISHRPSLFKYHPYLLRIGEGQKGDEWVFEQIGTSNSLVESVEVEVRKLEKQLGEIGGLKKRLEDINTELQLKPKEDDESLKHAKRSLI